MDNTQPTSKKLRFAVGGDGRPYSARWSVWAHNCNVYIASAPFGHAMKLSLHGDDGSPVCQLGHTGKYYSERIASRADAAGRAFIRWKRRPTPQYGVAQVVSLQFPADYLTKSPPNASRKKPVLVFPPGGPGTMVEIGVFYSRISPEMAGEHLSRTSTAIGWFALPNGDYVWVAGRVREYDPPVLPSGAWLSAGNPIPIRTRIWTESEKIEAIRASQGGKASAIVFNRPADGHVLGIIEVGGLELTKTEKVLNSGS